jgi:hypothetical protein
VGSPIPTTMNGRLRTGAEISKILYQAFIKFYQHEHEHATTNYPS